MSFVRDTDSNKIKTMSFQAKRIKNCEVYVLETIILGKFCNRLLNQNIFKT